MLCHYWAALNLFCHVLFDFCVVYYLNVFLFVFIYLLSPALFPTLWLWSGQSSLLPLVPLLKLWKQNKQQKFKMLDLLQHESSLLNWSSSLFFFVSALSCLLLLHQMFIKYIKVSILFSQILAVLLLVAGLT